MTTSWGRVRRLLACGLMLSVLLLAHLLADTRERLVRMEDELRVVTKDCLAREACDYREEP